MVSKHKVLSLVLYNENCERFCFYGLRSLLFLFLRTAFKLSYINSLLIVHTFLALSYSLPIVAGIILEMLIGSYYTIVNLSAVYFIGTIILAHCAAFPDDLLLLLTGLLMISAGIGGLKPCIAMSNVEEIEDATSAVCGALRNAECYTARREACRAEPASNTQLPKAFKCMYFILYLSTALSVVWSPLLADISCFGSHTCYILPFGLAAALLGCAILLLVAGSRYFNYTRRNHSAYKQIYGRLSRRIAAILGRYLAQDSDIMLEIRNTGAHGSNTDNIDFRSASRLLRFFIPVIFFWMLVEQQYTNWIEQGLNMKSTLMNELKEVSVKFPILNSLAMILFIPLLTGSIYIALRILDYRMGTLHNATVALFLGASSFIISAILEYKISNTDHRLSIIWQVPQYALMAFAELVMGMSGIASLYKEASAELREVVLCVWLFSIAVANIAIVLVSYVCTGAGGIVYSAQFFIYVVFGCLGLLASLKMHRSLVEYREEVLAGLPEDLDCETAK